jgi:hypothetical protein
MLDDQFPWLVHDSKLWPRLILVLAGSLVRPARPINALFLWYSSNLYKLLNALVLLHSKYTHSYSHFLLVPSTEHMNLRSNLLEKVPLPKNFSEKMEKKQIARRGRRHVGCWCFGITVWWWSACLIDMDMQYLVLFDMVLNVLATGLFDV